MHQYYTPHPLLPVYLNRAIYQFRHPRTAEIQRALKELGFSFDLHNPKVKHPKLIVYWHGQVLPPRVRFPAMRVALRDIGIRYRPLKDVCFLAAWQQLQEGGQR